MVDQTLLPLRVLSLVLVFGLLQPTPNTIASQKELDCALSLLSQLKEPRDKADALVEIAKLFHQEGDKKSADRLLSEALIWTAQIEDGLSKAAAIGAISEIGSVDQVERAAEIAKSIGGSHRALASRQLIVAYGRLGLIDKASDLLSEAATATTSEKTKNETWYGDREYALTLILADAAQAGLTDQALKIGMNVKDKFIKGDVLRAAAIELVEQKQYKRAISVARSIHYEIERIDALVDVANTAAKSGNKSSASEALSFALIETRKDIFDPEQDTKTKALVSISLGYENNGQRSEALTVLERAEKLAHTIEKPGFKDSGMSQVALAYARFRMFDKALQVTSNIPSSWSDVKARTLTNIAGYMIDAGEREQALSVLEQAFRVARDIDCAYFKYGISARSCFGDRARDFIAIAAAYEKAGLSEKEAEMLDLAVIQNNYKNNPPHQIIEEGNMAIGNDAVGEQEIINGYLAARVFKKAIEVASNIKNAKAKVVAVAMIEFKLANEKNRSGDQRGLLAPFRC